MKLLIFLCAFLSLTSAGLVVLVMNDVHLDLDYKERASPKTRCRSLRIEDSTRAPFGRRGCDSPKELLDSTLQKMREVVPFPDVIIVPGDLVTHALPLKHGPYNESLYAEVMRTIEHHAKAVADAFPQTPIIFTQGNDDFPVNYQVPNKTYKYKYYGLTYRFFITNIPANKFAVNLSSCQ